MIWTSLLLALTIALMLAVYFLFYAGMLIMPTPWAVALVVIAIAIWALANQLMRQLPLAQFAIPGLILATVGIFVGMLVRAFGPPRRSGRNYQIGATGIGVIGAAGALYAAAGSAYWL